MIVEALFYEEFRDKLRCLLCPHHCVLGKNQYGLCSVRANKNGSLKTINYGEITSIAMDPIEKKPLYHFKPTKNILSAGSFGCNFTCDFCQNYSIAQGQPESNYLSPEELIKIALRFDDNIGIAFTYNEPSIWYEYVLDTSKKLKETYPHLSIVLVTNGYIETEPLKKLLPFVDAMNIDLKAFQEDFYKKVCGGHLEFVKRTIEEAFERCHVEITTLLVNGLNDSEEEIAKVASYLGELDKNIPLHLSRYFPTYKMNRPATDIEVMLADKKIAEKYLNYVYVGNVDMNHSTYCPQCKKILIERTGFSSKMMIHDNVCPDCGYGIKIVL
ncbi:MAG: AmmeMemoRadiSam system radical SAM enzyme [Peptostreptococcales bacterium]|jgi:pyruvate formate lyase activating enzyme